MDRDIKPKELSKKEKDHILIKHKKVLKRMAETSGMTMGEAMRLEGYAEGYANSPDKVKDTRSWTKLMEDYLPENELAEKHRELLNAKNIGTFDFPSNHSKEDIKQIVEVEYGFKLIKIKIHPLSGLREAYYFVPDTVARDKALDKAYKLKGKYEPEKHSHQFDGLTKEELIELILGGIANKS